MEVKSLGIGPLVCSKCGRIAYHNIVFKTRWYAPIEIERIWTKANLRCCSCEEEYRMTDEAKKQYKLYKKNFGPVGERAAQFM